MSLFMLFIILAMLFLFGLVMTIVIVLLIRGRGPRVTQASCGKCLYAIEGLSGMTCPECGSDLRAVGIATPKSKRRVRPIVWIALWTIILPLPALFISRIVYVALPASWNNERYVTLRPNDDQSFTEVQLTLWANNTPQANEFEFASFELLKEKKAVGDEFIMDLNTRHWRIGDPDDDSAAMSDDPVSPEDVATWFNDSLEIDSSDQAIVIARELLVQTDTAAALKPMVLGDVFATGNINAVTWQQRPQWVRPVAWVFWLVVWVGGLLIIARRTTTTRSTESEKKTRIIDIAAK